MRLARFAVAGLALGIFAGFAAALLRPRQAAEGAGHRSLTEATGVPISWGARPDRAPLPPLVPVVPAERKGSVS